MDPRLRILAWVHIAIGVVGALPFFALAGGFIIAGDPAYINEFAWIGGVLGLATLAYFMPMTLAGIGLLKRWPWARALTWALAAALAVVVPVGTVLAGFSLWALLTTREISADGGIAKFEAFVRRMLPFVLCALAALFILGVILLAGYLFRDAIAPPREQILTPLPGAPDLPEIPEFKMPDLLDLPERPER